jgi:hypothetical protein
MKEGFEPFALANSHIVVEPAAQVAPADLPHKSSSGSLLFDSLKETESSLEFDGPAYTQERGVDYLVKFMLRGHAPNSMAPLWGSSFKVDQYWFGIASTDSRRPSLSLIDHKQTKSQVVRVRPPKGLEQLMAVLHRRLQERARLTRGEMSLVLTWHFEYQHQILLSVAVSHELHVPAGEFWRKIRYVLV